MKESNTGIFVALCRLAEGLILVIIAAVIFLTTSSAKADDVIDEVNITVPVSCSISGTGMDSHTATLPNGTYSGNYSGYTSGIGTTTLHAFCNDPDGLAIYATGFTGDEIGGTNSNKLVGSPSGIGNIETGLATSGDTSNWSMKLAIVSDTNDTVNNPLTIDSAPNTSGGANASFSSYHTVPNSYVKVAHKDASTSMDATTGGVKLNATYAAYISPLQPAGTYTGKVKYTLVNPSSEEPAQPRTTQSGKICYYANASNALGTMGCQNVASSVTLLASNFSREGYGFAGWSNKYDYVTNTDSDLKFYGPSETISLTAGQYTGSNPGLSLYAVWVKSAGSLQDSTKVSQLCGTGSGSLTQAPTDGTANLASVSALTDQRDNETYAIAKLADGNCWMIENLRLEAENTTGATNKSLAQGYAESTIFGNFIGLATAQPASAFTNTNPPAANSLYSTDGSTTVTIQGGDSSYYYERIPRYNNVNTPTLANVANRPQNPTANDSTNSTSDAGMYSYGNYYSWSAALANIIHYTGPTAQVDGYTSEIVNTSICPTGWRLPYGRSSGNGATSGGLYNLNYKINNDSNVTDPNASRKLRSYPNNFVYSGYVTSGSVNDRGSYGFYWSSTADNSYDAYYLSLFSSKVYPALSYDKYNGRSIRCVVSQ